MGTVLIIAICFLVAVGIYEAFRLSKRLIVLSEKIAHTRPYSSVIGCNDNYTGQKEKAYVSIEWDLEISFYGKVISSYQKNEFVEHYAKLYKEAMSLDKRRERFLIRAPKIVANLLDDFVCIDIYVERHNESVIKEILDAHKDFFDHCLSYPLDSQQRRAIVSDENNCLVISSAGSGKTSSIVGKVRYLVDIQHVAPESILLLSYTNKAAAELSERMNIAGLRGYTFHKLAIDIIGRVTGCKPLICDNSDAVMVKIYHKLLDEPKFRKSMVEYLADYPDFETDAQRQMDEVRRQLSEQKQNKLRALLPDMDGNPIYVRSDQERKICYILTSLGVNFRYEEPYEHCLADESHSQYKPDFSIYYNCGGQIKRVYLEHFGVDEHGLVPIWFAKDKNISYQEANKLYGDGIAWKVAAHEKFGTELITTTSADFKRGDIRDRLKSLLSAKGVPVEEKSETELYEKLLPKDGKRERVLIRLFITFITLMKSGCKSLDDLLRQACDADDSRSEFMMKNILRPMYERYCDELKSRGMIDFTDAIIEATKIVASLHPVRYSYIIVDEFQDISVDRYNFLKALRDGVVPAKLYCVGDDWQSIYRFSGSDMSLFSRFPDYFGPTEINKIETTYRFGEPVVSLSSQFIQRNSAQIMKNIRPFSSEAKTELQFCAYGNDYANVINQILLSIPDDKTVFLLGRYSFDDYYLSRYYTAIKENSRFYYVIGGRKIEFLTVHKSKGLEADYVIILQCNNGLYGFPSQMSSDSVLNYVLTESEQFPYGEERRLFYVAITRAKHKTFVLYDKLSPSVFVDEFMKKKSADADKPTVKTPRNANKCWTWIEDRAILRYYEDGMSIRQIAHRLERSPTAVIMRLGYLKTSAMD